jgi:hypothetical protein
MSMPAQEKVVPVMFEAFVYHLPVVSGIRDGEKLVKNEQKLLGR